MSRTKIPFCDVVLMLIREKPGRTRSEIAEEAASWRLLWSLWPKKFSAAVSLLGQRRDFTKALDREAEESVNASCSSGYAVEGTDGTFMITTAGQEWLRTESHL
jgi:hypothetical protein